MSNQEIIHDKAKYFIYTDDQKYDITEFVVSRTIIEGVRQSMTATLNLHPRVTTELSDLTNTGRPNFNISASKLFRPMASILIITGERTRFIGFSTGNIPTKSESRDQASRTFTANFTSIIGKMVGSEEKYFSNDGFLENSQSFDDQIAAFFKATEALRLQNEIQYAEIWSVIQEMFNQFSILKERYIQSADVYVKDMIYALVRDIPGDRIIKFSFYNYQGNLKQLLDSMVEPELYYYTDTVSKDGFVNIFILKPFPFEYRDKNIREAYQFVFTDNKNLYSGGYDFMKVDPPPDFNNSLDRMSSRYWDDLIVDLYEHDTIFYSFPESDSEMFSVFHTRVPTDVTGISRDDILKNIYNIDMIKRIGFRVKRTQINSLSFNIDDVNFRVIPDSKENNFVANRAQYLNLQVIKRNLIFKYYAYPYYRSGNFTSKNDNISVGQVVRLNHFKLSDNANNNFDPMEAFVISKTEQHIVGQGTVYTYSCVRGHSPKMVAQWFTENKNNFKTNDGAFLNINANTVTSNKTWNELLLGENLAVKQ